MFKGKVTSNEDRGAATLQIGRDVADGRSYALPRVEVSSILITAIQEQSDKKVRHGSELGQWKCSIQANCVFIGKRCVADVSAGGCAPPQVADAHYHMSVSE